MSDPFDSVTPIGRARAPEVSEVPLPKLAASARNRFIERKPSTLDSSVRTDGAVAKEPGRRKGKLKTAVTVEELKDKAGRLARKAYTDAMTLEKAVDRKNATASFGIAVDKLTMLSGRPTQIHEVRSEEREGMEELCRRLLGMPAS